MARTLEEIRASRPEFDRAKIEATTEADIRRHAAEDGSEAAAPLSEFIKRRPGQRGPGKRPALVSVTLRLEPETLAAYRETGEGWQRRMRAVLRDGQKKSG